MIEQIRFVQRNKKFLTEREWKELQEQIARTKEAQERFDAFGFPHHYADAGEQVRLLKNHYQRCADAIEVRKGSLASIEEGEQPTSV